jgi:FAD/FMN-containing dehydrogenase
LPIPKLRRGNAWGCVSHTTAGDSVTVPDAALAALRAGLRGQLIQPSDVDYDEARAVWNGLIDKRPGLIVRCAGVADVMAAVNFGREHDLRVGVRGAGHNSAGIAVPDDGLLIDLSPMRSVRVDPSAQTVRAEGGVTIGELDHETQALGLAVPMGDVSSTGIAGLSLGGGIGWLRRKYGLSCDNLRSADVVTAEGRLVSASAETDPELLWGLKGGGGNFGIVTSFEFETYPVGPDVFFAFVLHPGTAAGAALRFFREWAATAPDEVSAYTLLWHIPEIEGVATEHHHMPSVVYVAVHCGDVADGAEVLQPLRDFGTPLADLSAPMPYLRVQRFWDADFPAHERRYYWRSRYLSELTDEAIGTLVELNEASPSLHSTLDVWQLGGRMSRVAPDETTFDRSAPFLIEIESNWEHPDDDTRCVAWAREAYGTLERFSTDGEYLNFPGLYENGEQMVQNTFGANLDRLRALKQRYDPTNLFRLNHNITPS